MKKLFIILVFSCQFLVGRGQCLDNNIQLPYPPAPVTISCPSATSRCLMGGEFALVNVVNGTTYTFSTCGTTVLNTEITLYTHGGSVLMGYSNDDCGLQSSISWSATFTGLVRVLIDIWPCVSSGLNDVCLTLNIKCCGSISLPQDCKGGTTICNSQSFTNNSNTVGCVTDLVSSNKGCLTNNENQGTWYYFSPSISGTIGFTINPFTSTDYDFAVWGPMAQITCPPQGQPLRCSYKGPPFGGPYTTGCKNGETDTSESPSTGNGWVSTFNVIAGQKFILYIDNYNANGQAFEFTWQLTNGASLDCTPLPVELISFSG